MVQEATTACDAVLVDVAGPAVDELVAATPAFVAATIPAGLYRGTRRAVATFGVGATLVTRAEVPEDRIYTVVAVGLRAISRCCAGSTRSLVGLEPRGDGAGRPGGAAASRRRALLPRARLDGIAPSVTIPIAWRSGAATGGLTSPMRDQWLARRAEAGIVRCPQAGEGETASLGGTDANLSNAGRGRTGLGPRSSVVDADRRQQ